MQTTGVQVTGRAMAMRTTSTSTFLRSSFLPRLEALRTEVDVLLGPVFGDMHPLYVGVPAALGVPHGMAHVIAKLRPLAATIALGHLNTPCMTEVVNKPVTDPRGLGHKLCNLTTGAPVRANFCRAFFQHDGFKQGIEA